MREISPSSQKRKRQEQTDTVLGHGIQFADAPNGRLESVSIPQTPRERPAGLRWTSTLTMEMPCAPADWLSLHSPFSNAITSSSWCWALRAAKAGTYSFLLTTFIQSRIGLFYSNRLLVLSALRSNQASARYSQMRPEPAWVMGFALQGLGIRKLTHLGSSHTARLLPSCPMR